MKVTVTSIAPVGFIEIYEDGCYQTGDLFVDSHAKTLRAAGQHEVVPLGVLLPLLNLACLTPVDEARRVHAGTCDERVPALLKALRALPSERDEFYHAMLLDGYWEQLNPPHGSGRRLFRTLEVVVDDERHVGLRLEETNTHSWPVWTAHAEVSVGRRGYFRMELSPTKVDTSFADHVLMLNLFVADLTSFCVAWGERLAAAIDAPPFTISIDRTWEERSGIASKTSVEFHLDVNVDRTLLERIIEQAEPDATLERYDAETKTGAWFLVDARSAFVAGNLIYA